MTVWPQKWEPITDARQQGERKMNREKLTENTQWNKLKDHYHQIKKHHLRDLFSADKKRAEKFTLIEGDICFDFSKNRITEETLQLLIQLAESQNLQQEIERMFTGEKINRTENRAVLHVALRNLSKEPILVDGKAPWKP